MTLGFYILLISLPFWGMLAYRLYRNNRGKNWKQTKATVLESRLLKETVADGGPFYSSKIVYEYQVNGTQYKGERVNIGGNIDTSWSVPPKKRIRKFPQGAIVDAYYNPDDPSESCLVPSDSCFWLALICAALLACSLFYRNFELEDEVEISGQGSISSCNNS